MTMFITIFYVLALICFAISGAILFLKAWEESWLPAEGIMAVTGLIFAIIAAIIYYAGKYL